jgi:hypothetical protein
MSTVQNQVAATNVAPTEKKARKPTLSAKYSKFLVSNYSIIQMLQAKGLLSDEAVETAYTEIKLFNSVEDQSAFYESFLESSKATGKTMNKFVTQRLKPPKAPRAKKERKPKAEKSEADAQAKPKKPRTKKETKVADDTKQDLVAQLVEAANAPMPAAEKVQNTPVQVVAEAKEAPGAPKKEKKPRAKKEAKDKEEKPKEKKPRGKKAKAEPVVEAAAPVVAEEEEEEEIHTQEIKIGDDTYLIDGDNNLYSVETHEQVGTFNAETNQVVAV